MKKHLIYKTILLSTLFLPTFLQAQAPGGVQKLHTVLQNLYNEMIPLCENLIDVARAIGGFGALWFIGYRVWKHIANAEAIDFFPLLRPFTIALLITFYPYVLKIMNGILSPMVISTSELVKDTNDGVKKLLEARAKSIVLGEDYESLAGGLGNDDKKEWYKYQQPEEEKQEGFSLGKALKWSLSIVTNTVSLLVKMIISFFLQILYYAAALCIDTMRTFHLIILALLGPFVLCLSIFDGFQHTLQIWVARYINVFLWLPIANLFAAMIGRIQQGWLRLDIDQTSAGDILGVGPTDIAYLIFLVIAIVGYFTVPSIANYIVHASGASTLLSKTNSLVIGGGKSLVGAAVGGPAGAGAMSRDMPGSDMKMSSMADAANSEPYVKDGNNYQHNKLSGKA